MEHFLRPRRGKKSDAESVDIVLERGEVFFEAPETGVGTGAGRIKVGDGTTAYTSLPYFFDYDNISGGHEIQNAAGTALAQEDTLQFAGYLKTTDDSTHERTVVSDAPTEITYEEYNLLTPQQKAGVKWLITGAPAVVVDSVEASHVTYSNASSGLPATDAQAAIDDIVSSLGTAAAKAYTTSVSSGSTDLVTSGAVYSYVDSMITQAIQATY